MDSYTMLLLCSLALQALSRADYLMVSACDADYKESITILTEARKAIMETNKTLCSIADSIDNAIDFYLSKVKGELN